MTISPRPALPEDGGRPGAVPAPDRSADAWVVLLAGALLAFGALWVAASVNGRQGLLLLVGGGLGVALYHAAFGFTSAWRLFIVDRRGAGLRAQMVMLAVACALFYPSLAAGSFLGQPLGGFVAPVGVSVVAGAFLFGVGMQLGGGCASGTLFTAGGGNVRMLATLAGFIAGSVVGAAHLHWWLDLPAFAPVSLVREAGLWPALGAHLVAFALIAAATIGLERRRHGRLLAGEAASRPGWHRLVHGPWPLLWGAVALAFLNFATLALSGRPWGITSAFALWGSKLLWAAGMDVAAWPYWAERGGAAALDRSLLEDVTSVMNFGLVLGAMLAAGLAGRFRPDWRIPRRSLIAALLGGLLLGYGARLAFGCNIGAFFSGIASSSPHGWAWFAAALAGNMLGARLRPFFGLVVESSRAPRAGPA